MLLGEPVDTGTVPVGTSWCTPYSGFLSQHTHWNYAVLGASTTGTQLVETAGWSEEAVSTSETLHLGAADGSYEVDATGSRSWACSEEGLLLVEDDLDSRTTYADGHVVEHLMTTTYSPPFLYLPADLTADSTWTATPTGTATLDGESAEISSVADYRVVGTARIEVPAGGFDTLEILGVAQTPMGETRDHRFVADAIGAVQFDEVYQLSGYRGE